MSDRQVAGAQQMGAPLAALQAIGRDACGTNRLAWTAELAAAEAWFAEQARDAGLSLRRDPAGSLWAVPDTPPPWWGVGSHLDSVRRGGAFDGALGVAAAFAVARRSRLPLAVLAFADEEGARFNTPTFGSRALAGMLDVDDALGRADQDGVTLRAALGAAGVDPAGICAATTWLARLRGFLELHIDQSTDVFQSGAPVGVVDTVAARRRVRVDIHGASDHAGTTPPGERRDALAAAAALIVAAEGLHSADATLRSSANRIVAEPNSPTAIAARATVLFDARAARDGALDDWVTELRRAADVLAGQRRVRIDVRLDSSSPAARFDPGVVRALTGHAPAGTPTVVCFAGHDAAILAPHIPAGMVLVANASGVSHSPAEQVSLSDAAAGVEVLLGALDGLA